ncbi:MAG TPA: NUDIX domain-containing protein [Tepidisphaeraceae bacterium]|jgi:8-oxo-dGTP pyrophosphatase MutT (NUDIX family)
MISTQDVLNTLDIYCQRFPETAEYVADLRELVAESPSCLSRSEFRGHITCSALVTNTDGEILLIHHRALDRWLAPGGHVERNDDSLAAAAMRELSEETGIAREKISISPWWARAPLHVDRHTIPANPAKNEPEHEHWDFCYRLNCDSPTMRIDADEVCDVRWCSPGNLPERFYRTMRAMKACEAMLIDRIP